MAVESGKSDTCLVRLNLRDDELAEARAGARSDEFAPSDEEQLFRYLVYLGTAYVEAERVMEAADSWAEAFARLDRHYGGVSGEASVLHFHYGESARRYADEQRAQAAHERMAGAYEALIEKMEQEIQIREQRIRNLEEAERRWS